MKLVEITEYDRKLKEAQKAQMLNDEGREDPKNLITKFFNRPTHQAYELRAK